ncbi:endo-1,4-beta-xylanase [Actinoalloteichus hymeniacidonis]|uniref:Beta-xylanase n=1 Tax=Actinoalloteichus hymeniacidonis TaxID=340345 RepID=A0AAC9HQR4_9PSEU|nr:endo-1,4-beta-xylanase [Actinoalloteichus hymeniacidonis]AOS63897.1 beta-1,4-xylanase [Actinoalloteichus hymeniacidonis]MBB5908047.1 endo-1,4-beta-xylanase [Actinoalloteichus hymeniacidonis]
MSSSIGTGTLHRRWRRIAGLLASTLLAATTAILVVPTAQGMETDQPPPLKELTDRYVGSAVAAGPLASEADYRATLGREFDSVTAENEMKWSSVEPNRGQYNWSGADQIVEFADQNGQSVRGHTLVWHSQLPNWLQNGDFSAEELRGILQNHITTIVTRYRGSIRAWDVVNEVFNEDGSLRDSIWLRQLGPDYIADAFRWAREADPSVKLYINDYNTENINAKSDATYALVQDLRAQGVPIDGVGFQTHLATKYGLSDSFQPNLERFAALGVDVAITELDVRVDTPSDAAKLAAQAELYKRVWDGCLAVDRCVEFTVWGFTDRHSWVPGTFPGEGEACLFDASLNAKPAYRALNPG